MILTRRRLLAASAAAALPALPGTAWAQGYPNRPVRIIVATAAGGTTDLAGRLIAQWLADKLGQAFTVENRTGGSNNIGTEAAVRSPPDGYTLFMANSVNAINTSLFPNLTFSFSTDLVPVAIAMKSVLVLQVHPSVPVKTLPEFIAYGKANPGKINMGSGGMGSTGAMCGELFQLMAGVNSSTCPIAASRWPRPTSSAARCRWWWQPSARRSSTSRPDRCARSPSPARSGPTCCLTFRRSARRCRAMRRPRGAD